ncbi:hypothetical protein P7K49_009098 [Saguinus oedipus]|uniref:Uncharacterized protein n=1 Tax=Saguinus oedipus TaxID=9490 RepID=A0ABQ9W393_SAGOE|nr:hypothetical protein P7K49_009098 [Saguinus oedipus]
MVSHVPSSYYGAAQCQVSSSVLNRRELSAPRSFCTGARVVLPHAQEVTSSLVFSLPVSLGSREHCLGLQLQAGTSLPDLRCDGRDCRAKVRSWRLQQVGPESSQVHSVVPFSPGVSEGTDRKSPRQ